MRSLLMVLGYFPPVGGPPVQYVLRYISYLPEFGWKPYVLTLKKNSYFAFDDSLLDEIPKDVFVKRTPALDYAHIKLLGKSEDRIIADRRWRPQDTFPEGVKALEFLIRKYLLIPDGQIGWLPFAVPAGLELVRKNDISCIYARVPQFSASLVGYALKMLTGKPLILDFSDEWVTAKDFYLRPRIRQRVEISLERHMVLFSDFVIGSGEAVTEHLMRRYPEKPKSRFVTLPLGFNERIFSGVKSTSPSDRFVLLYTGSLEPYDEPKGFAMTPKYLLEGLSLFLKERPDARIVLRFVGHFPDFHREKIARLNLERFVETPGYLPHRYIPRELMSASSLLLLYFSSTGSPRQLPGKLFEYMRAGKPVLALMPDECETARILKKANLGIFAPPEEPEAIKRSIKELYSLWEEEKLDRTPNWDYIYSFEHKKVTRRLAQLLDKVSDEYTHR
ncbi:glycosyltransferase [bacterium]|nr:glycosyltransferase [bacterium]